MSDRRKEGLENVDPVQMETPHPPSCFLPLLVLYTGLRCVNIRILLLTALLNQFWSQRTSESSYYFIILLNHISLLKIMLMSGILGTYACWRVSMCFLYPEALKQNNNIMFFSPVTIFSRTFFQVTFILGKDLCFVLLFYDFPTPTTWFLYKPLTISFKPSAHGLCNQCGYIRKMAQET